MSEAGDKLGTSMRRHSVRLGLFALGAAILLASVNLRRKLRSLARAQAAFPAPAADWNRFGLHNYH